MDGTSQFHNHITIPTTRAIIQIPPVILSMNLALNFHTFIILSFLVRSILITLLGQCCSQSLHLMHKSAAIILTKRHEPLSTNVKHPHGQQVTHFPQPVQLYVNISISIILTTEEKEYSH